MADFRYFCDMNGATVELRFVSTLARPEFESRWPGVKGKRYDGYYMRVGFAEGSREPLPITRIIEYKARPSKHECDSRCMNATGRTMKCECSCGGKNRGRGSTQDTESA